MNGASPRRPLTVALDFTLHHPLWALGIASGAVTALALLWSRGQGLEGSGEALAALWISILWILRKVR